MSEANAPAASPQTRLTKAYGVRYPIAAAGMGFVGMTPDLAIAVCQAGGIGALGVGKMPPPRDLDKVNEEHSNLEPGPGLMANE